MNGKTLRTHLSTNSIEHELRRLLDNLSGSAKYINSEIRKSVRGVTDGTNQFGERQLQLDILADQIIQGRLQPETSFGICDFASEEQGEIINLHPSRGRYSITVDPLDGSSLVDVNLSVGTIFGIHDGPLGEERSGRESLVAAMYVVYGPETSLVYATNQDGVHEFVLNPQGDWVLVRENIMIENKGKIYSPGGLRKEWTEEHAQFMADLEEQGYKLRYSGALVADFNQVLMKGGGIFSYPALQGKPNGKLRLLFELQPLSTIIERSGGAATDGVEHILDKTLRDIDERSPIYIGSKHEVELAGKYLANVPKNS